MTDRRTDRPSDTVIYRSRARDKNWTEGRIDIRQAHPPIESEYRKEHRQKSLNNFEHHSYDPPETFSSITDPIQDAFSCHIGRVQWFHSFLSREDLNAPHPPSHSVMKSDLVFRRLENVFSRVSRSTCNLVSSQYPSFQHGDQT